MPREDGDSEVLRQCISNAPTCVENPDTNMFPLKTMEDEVLDDFGDEVGEVEDEVRNVP